MNSFASHYALFLAEAVTLVLAAIALVAGLAALSRRRAKHAGQIEVTDINCQLEAAGDRIEAARLPKKAFKALAKQRKAEHKARQQGEAGPCSYLIDFKGNLRASAFVALREEITAIL